MSIWHLLSLFSLVQLTAIKSHFHQTQKNILIENNRVEKVNGNDIINRSLLKFDLPTIGTGSQVIKASLNLFDYPDYTNLGHKPGRKVSPSTNQNEKALLDVKYKVFLEQCHKQQEYRALVDQTVSLWE